MRANNSAIAALAVGCVSALAVEKRYTDNCPPCKPGQYQIGTHPNSEGGCVSDCYSKLMLSSVAIGTAMVTFPAWSAAGRLIAAGFNAAAQPGGVLNPRDLVGVTDYNMTKLSELDWEARLTQELTVEYLPDGSSVTTWNNGTTGIFTAPAGSGKRGEATQIYMNVWRNNWNGNNANREPMDDSHGADIAKAQLQHAANQRGSAACYCLESYNKYHGVVVGVEYSGMENGKPVHFNCPDCSVNTHDELKRGLTESSWAVRSQRVG